MSVLLADIGGTNIRLMLLNETQVSFLQYYKNIHNYTLIFAFLFEMIFPFFDFIFIYTCKLSSKIVIFATRSALDAAPTCLSTTLPPLKKSTVGMLLMPYSIGASSHSSTLHLQTSTLPVLSTIEKYSKSS